MGPHVRAHVPLPAVLGADLPQPASLVGKPYARRRHRLSAMLERFHAVRQTPTPAGAGQRAKPSRPRRLRPEVARLFHAVLHRRRARARRLPSSAVLCPDRVLRQPRLLSPRHARQARRAAPRRQSHHRSAKQDHDDLRPQGSPSSITANCRPRSNTWTSPTR